MKRNGFFTDEVRTFLTVGTVVIIGLVLILKSQPANPVTEKKEVQEVQEVVKTDLGLYGCPPDICALAEN